MLLCALLAFLASLAPVGGGDTWWYLATGRFIVGQGYVPLQDPFSFTASGATWINPEWLSNVLFFGVAHRWGDEGLFVLKVALAASILALVAVRIHRSTQQEVSTVCGTIFVAAGLWGFLDIRAQLFTFFFALLSLEILEAKSRFVPKALALFALTVLWANLHGGVFLLFLLIALCWWLDPAGNRVSCAGLFLVVVAASLCTPYGWLVYRNVAAHALLPLGTIFGYEGALASRTLEWLSPLHFDVPGFTTLLFWPSLLILGFLWVTNSRQVSPFVWGVAFVAAAMALASRRFIPLFFLLSADVLVGGVWAWVESATRWRGRFAVGTAGAALCCFLVVLPHLRAGISEGFFAYTTAEATFPQKACDMLQAKGFKGRVLNFYNWGGYLLWRLYPEVTVFVDGRSQTIYSPELLRLRQQVDAGEGWSDMCDRFGVDAMVLNRVYQARLIALANASGAWRLLFEDDVAAVLMRQ